MGDADNGAMYSTVPAQGLYVCDDCFGDDTIKEFIRSEVERATCDFCGRKGRTGYIAAPLDGVVEFMYQSIDREYERAVEALGYESAEGGYLGRHWDSYDMLTDELEMDFPNDADGRLLQIIADCLGGEPWCERNPYSLSPAEKLSYSWEQFSELIKHQRRYFFLRQNRQEDRHPREHLTAAELLRLIGETVKEHRLIHTLTQGTVTYRARQQRPGETLRSTYDLGPPPVERATRSNRMSPAGIVMFYSSGDPQTAIAEIDDESKQGITVGTFRITKEVKILDLTHLPPPVPFFQPDCSFDRYALNFFHGFVSDLSKKVEPGEWEHIDYVPPQVVTEWFRSVFRYHDSLIGGIRYPSAARKGGESLVLFANRDDLKLRAEEVKELERTDSPETWGLRAQQKDAWLQLIRVTLHRPATGP